METTQNLTSAMQIDDDDTAFESPHAHHVTTAAGELLDADGSHCVSCVCAQCVEDDD